MPEVYLWLYRALQDFVSSRYLARRVRRTPSRNDADERSQPALQLATDALWGSA